MVQLLIISLLDTFCNYETFCIIGLTRKPLKKNRIFTLFFLFVFLSSLFAFITVGRTLWSNITLQRCTHTHIRIKLTAKVKIIDICCDSVILSSVYTRASANISLWFYDQFISLPCLHLRRHMCQGLLFFIPSGLYRT